MYLAGGGILVEGVDLFLDVVLDALTIVVRHVDAQCPFPRVAQETIAVVLEADDAVAKSLENFVLGAQAFALRPRPDGGVRGRSASISSYHTTGRFALPFSSSSMSP